jgi:rhodanese-related sulfurtransferase
MRERVILTGIMMVVVLWGAALGDAVPAAEGASIRVEPPSITAGHGESFTIEIMIEPDGASLYAAQYVLYYDPTILNATAQTQGSLLGQDGKSTNVYANFINTSLGKLEYAESRMGVSSGVATPGVLATISFTVIGTSGTSDFLFSDVILVDADSHVIQPLSTQHGSFSIPTSSGDGGGSSATPPLPAVSPLTVEQVYALLQDEPGQCTLVDTRTAEAYATEHIAVPGVETKNIPESELEQRYGELEKTKKVIVYDQSGSGSRTAGEKLVEHGFEAVSIMLGGFDEWKKMHYPTTLLAGPTATPTATALTPPLPTSKSSPEPTAPATGTPTPASTGTQPASPTTEPGLPGFELSCAILGVLAIAALTLKCRKRV